VLSLLQSIIRTYSDGHRYRGGYGVWKDITVHGFGYSVFGSVNPTSQFTAYDNG
jgi:hypothetical protein